MQLTISAKNAAELKSKIVDLAILYGVDVRPLNESHMRNSYSGSDPDQLSFPLETHPNNSGPDSQVLQTGRRGPGRPPSAKAKKVSSEELAPPTQIEPKTETENPEKLTLDHVKDVLSKLNETKGMEVARAVVNDYGVPKISALKEEQYGPFINSCMEKLSE